MPRITMKGRVSGTRDGQEWPAPGGSIDVSDDEAASLVQAGIAVLADIETAVAPTSDIETAVAPTRRTRGSKTP